MCLEGLGVEWLCCVSVCVSSVSLSDDPMSLEDRRWRQLWKSAFTDSPLGAWPFISYSKPMHYRRLTRFESFRNLMLVPGLYTGDGGDCRMRRRCSS